MHKSLFLALLITSCSASMAQQFGGHPPSTRWRQVNTDSVRVIFPAGLESSGKEVAGIIARIGQQPQGLLGNRLRKISIVLQPNTTISNGYVGLGPWRSEFYLTPPQNSFQLGSLQWQQSLALHEFRHVEQYSNFRKGISKLAYILFGEQAQDLVNSAAIPNWFFEGDAVYQETILSHQGRGRVPAFFNDYRALWAGRKNYSWMKLRNGSLRDLVPDHYRLGYMMVAYGREKYGADIWQKITDDAARFRGLFYPLQHAVKKYTGEDYSQFRQHAIEYFSQHFKDSSYAEADNWGKDNKHYKWDTEFPQWLDDHTLIYVKSSYKQLPAFVTEDHSTGKIEKLRMKDVSLDSYFSLRNGKIVYAAFEPDIRWSWRNYSVIKWLDIASNQQRTLTHHTQLFSPDISEDGNTIVAVKILPGEKPELQLLSSADGHLLRSLPNPDNLFYTYPKFAGLNSVVTAVRNNEGEMALGSVDLQSGEMKYLTPFSYNVIGFPSVHKDTILFSASAGTLDRFFVITNGKLYKLENTEASKYTGQYQAQLAYGQLAYPAYTAVGDMLVRKRISANDLQEVSAATFSTPPSTQGITEFDKAKLHAITAIAADSALPVGNYSQSFRLFNFHSWRPFVDDPDYTISLLGENVLNTLQSEVYFNYNNNERNKQAGINLTYAQLFPWIRLGSNYTFDRPYNDGKYAFFFNEWNSYAGLNVPLNFSKGRSLRSFNVGSDIAYKKQYIQGHYKDSFNTEGFAYIRPFLSFVNQVQTARMHILPRWGQNIQFTYSRAVSRLKANQFLATGYWYFPGLLPTHNLVFNTSFQKRDTGTYIFSSSFPFSRGYNGSNFPEMWKLGVNYHLPLMYPDAGIANIVYFLRVRANLFYDHTNVLAYSSGIGRHFELRSYGTEIYFDTKWWNQHNVTFGVRYSRLRDGALQRLNANQWEFIMPVNLLGSR